MYMYMYVIDLLSCQYADIGIQYCLLTNNEQCL